MSTSTDQPIELTRTPSNKVAETLEAVKSDIETSETTAEIVKSSTDHDNKTADTEVRISPTPSSESEVIVSSTEDLITAINSENVDNVENVDSVETLISSTSINDVLDPSELSIAKSNSEINNNGNMNEDVVPVLNDGEVINIDNKNIDNIEEIEQTEQEKDEKPESTIISIQDYETSNNSDVKEESSLLQQKLSKLHILIDEDKDTEDAIQIQPDDEKAELIENLSINVKESTPQSPVEDQIEDKKKVGFQLTFDTFELSKSVKPRDNLADLLKDALKERDQLTIINTSLQKKILAFKSKEKDFNDEKMDKVAETSANAMSEDNLKTNYLQLLQEAFAQRERLKMKQSSSKLELERLHSRFDTKNAQAMELASYFRDFKREMAKGSQFLRTGQSIPAKRIFKFEAEEEELETRVEEVRTKNIFLRNQLKKLEKQIGQKETLADTGLALIDFEQLKIENQTLNEKIEERNDELHKLGKKTTTTVQVLSHIKEKLSFVNDDNSIKSKNLSVLDTQLTQLRDQLARTKQLRDTLRLDNLNMKQNQGFVSSDLLVVDFDQRKHTIEELEKKLVQLQDRYKECTTLIKQAEETENRVKSPLTSPLNKKVIPSTPADVKSLSATAASARTLTPQVRPPSKVSTNKTPTR